MPTALLSVYDKTGIADFAAALDDLGWRIVSSGGTARVVADAGVPVTDVADLTGVPAILGLVMVVWIVLELMGVSLPDTVITFDRAQLEATWGISAFGIMLSWISADFGGTGKGAGFWLMFFGSLAMAIGAVMALLGRGTETVDLPGTTSSSDGPESTRPPLPPPAP